MQNGTQMTEKSVGFFLPPTSVRDLDLSILRTLPISKVFEMRNVNKNFYHIATCVIFERRGAEACRYQEKLLSHFWEGIKYPDSTPLNFHWLLKVGGYSYDANWWERQIRECLRDFCGTFDHKLACLLFLCYLTGLPSPVEIIRTGLNTSDRSNMALLADSCSTSELASLLPDLVEHLQKLVEHNQMNLQNVRTILSVAKIIPLRFNDFIISSLLLSLDTHQENQNRWMCVLTVITERMLSAVQILPDAIQNFIEIMMRFLRSQFVSVRHQAYDDLQKIALKLPEVPSQWIDALFLLLQEEKDSFVLPVATKALAATVAKLDFSLSKETIHAQWLPVVMQLPFELQESRAWLSWYSNHWHPMVENILAAFPSSAEKLMEKFIVLLTKYAREQDEKSASFFKAACEVIAIIIPKLDNHQVARFDREIFSLLTVMPKYSSTSVLLHPTAFRKFLEVLEALLQCSAAPPPEVLIDQLIFLAAEGTFNYTTFVAAWHPWRTFWKRFDDLLIIIAIQSANQQNTLVKKFTYWLKSENRNFRETACKFLILMAPHWPQLRTELFLLVFSLLLDEDEAVCKAAYSACVTMALFALSENSSNTAEVFLSLAVAQEPKIFDVVIQSIIETIKSQFELSVTSEDFKRLAAILSSLLKQSTWNEEIKCKVFETIKTISKLKLEKLFCFSDDLIHLFCNLLLDPACSVRLSVSNILQLMSFQLETLPETFAVKLTADLNNSNPVICRIACNAVIVLASKVHAFSQEIIQLLQSKLLSWEAEQEIELLISLLRALKPILRSTPCSISKELMQKICHLLLKKPTGGEGNLLRRAASLLPMIVPHVALSKEFIQQVCELLNSREGEIIHIAACKVLTAMAPRLNPMDLSTEHIKKLFEALLVRNAQRSFATCEALLAIIPKLPLARLPEKISDQLLVFWKKEGVSRKVKEHVLCVCFALIDRGVSVPNSPDPLMSYMLETYSALSQMPQPNSIKMASF